MYVTVIHTNEAAYRPCIGTETGDLKWAWTE